MELLSTGIFRTIVKKISPVIPQIEKPKKKVTLKNKLIWTGIALLIYFVMGQVPLFGTHVDPNASDPLAFARVIFAAQQRTLLELGIGPIVTAGLLMQLLKGSDILKLNFKDPDDRCSIQPKEADLTAICAKTLVRHDKSSAHLNRGTRIAFSGVARRD